MPDVFRVVEIGRRMTALFVPEFAAPKKLIQTSDVTPAENERLIPEAASLERASFAFVTVGVP